MEMNESSRWTEEEMETAKKGEGLRQLQAATEAHVARRVLTVWALNCACGTVWGTGSPLGGSDGHFSLELQCYPPVVGSVWYVTCSTVCPRVTCTRLVDSFSDLWGQHILTLRVAALPLGFCAVGVPGHRVNPHPHSPASSQGMQGPEWLVAMCWDADPTSSL